MQKTYIADGVYAELDEFDRLVLTTEDSIGVTNKIVFEPQTWALLQVYLQRIDAQIFRWVNK